MSTDTVLARKWRPRQFSEVVGQEAVVRALSQALDSGRLHHAYLFTGTRGVGKTTLARIFAKALNCRHGLSSAPCTDDISQAIDEGRFVDLIEIDAASKTKVEDTRELLDNVQYAPSVGRFKIYLIDEVHMLSTHSFNALLKTLEEPPEHVKFLLATTDPHKLPVTILSRCLQFHLRPMVPEILTQHLARVLTEEKITFEQEAITLVSKMAQGSVRDALSLLDQAIILGGGSVGYDSTREMLGLASTAQILALLDAIANQDREDVLDQLHQWTSWGADFDRLQQQLLEQLHELAMIQVFPSLAESALVEQRQLLEQISAELVQIWLQVALLAKEDMQIAPTAQMGFEIMVMRLLHFRAMSSKPVSTTVTHSILPIRQPQKTPTKSNTSPQSRIISPLNSTPEASPVIATPVPTKAVEEIDFSLLLGLVGAQKKTLTLSPVSETQSLTTPAVSPVTIAQPTPESFANLLPEHEEIAPIDDQTIDIFASSHFITIDTKNQTHTQINATDNTTNTTEEPLTHSEQIIVAPKTTETPTLLKPDFIPYTIEQWREQLTRWRLNPMQLGIAERCVRLISDDPDQILLACPPAEAASFALMREKLAQAINKAQPNAKVSWVLAWQDSWMTLQQHVQVLSEQEKQVAREQISQDERFSQTCQILGLSAQWDRLTPRTLTSIDIEDKKY